MTKSERMEKHYGFMCAALTGVIASPRAFSGFEDLTVANNVVIAIAIADAALASFEARWEDKPQQERVSEEDLKKQKEYMAIRKAEDFI